MVRYWSNCLESRKNTQVSHKLDTFVRYSYGLNKDMSIQKLYREKVQFLINLNLNRIYYCSRRQLFGASPKLNLC